MPARSMGPPDTKRPLRRGCSRGLMQRVRCRVRTQSSSVVDQGYIGVLVDDLVNLGTAEPYRMFTSRAEYRLLLREDNADQRLTEIGRHIGLIADDRWRRFEEKMDGIARGRELLREKRLQPSNEADVQRLGLPSLRNGVTYEELLRRPEIEIETLAQIDPNLVALDGKVREQLEISVKYEGYIQRQEEDVKRFRRMEEQVIPSSLDYEGISGLSAEVRDKLKRVRPLTLGQASRIPGVTPAAVAIVAVILRRR